MNICIERKKGAIDILLSWEKLSLNIRAGRNKTEEEVFALIK
jgi:hypothetical protein